MKYTWLVEKYLEGELSGEALRKFELEILRKPEVAEEVERVRSMNQFMMEQHGKFQDSIGLIEDYEDSDNVIDEEIIRQDLDGLKVKKISADQDAVRDLKTKIMESKVSHNLINERSNKVLVRKISVWSAAASIAILMIISISLFTDKSASADYKSVYLQFYSPYPSDNNNRDLAQGMEDTYEKALYEYDQKNYKTAYQLLQKIPEASPPEFKFYLYKGVAAMESGEFQVAIKSFSNLQSHARLNHYGMWYTGLAHLAMDDIPAARKKLEEIIAADGHFKKPAKKLLRKI